MVDCIPMASRHHPHHPNYTYNNYSYTYSPTPRRSSSSSNSNSSYSASHSNFSSNNPYAHIKPTSPSPTPSSTSYRRPVSLTLSEPWNPDTFHQRERERKRSSTTSIPRRRSHRYPRSSQLVNPDIIDQLDDVTNYSYHHEGPYDAVCPERNRVSQRSPLEAVRESNEEALRATPRDKIIDCLNSHRPLDGVAFFPPGETDRYGQTYSYEEGSNMMNDYGNFMRTPGQKFTDEDFKNDPFYNRPLLNPFASLKRKLSLKRNKMRRSTA